MKEFQIICPSELLAPYIKQYWFLKIDDVKRGFQRSIPSGCTALVFHRGNKIFSSLHNGLQPQSYLSGQLISYSDIEYSYLNMIIVVFQPGSCHLFFPYLVHEFIGKNIDIGLLSDRALAELNDRLNETLDNRQCVYIIEEYLLRKLYDADSYNYARMQAVIKEIDKGEWNISVLSEIACLGCEQFRRIFRRYTGLNPKEFLEIVRFKKAFHLLQLSPQIGINKLVDDCGYYDKSHLIKEFKAFTGYAPGELMTICDPYTEYLSLFNSFFINGKKNF